MALTIMPTMAGSEKRSSRPGIGAFPNSSVLSIRSPEMNVVSNQKLNGQ
jgi:hypothetical protein